MDWIAICLPLLQLSGLLERSYWSENSFVSLDFGFIAGLFSGLLGIFI